VGVTRIESNRNRHFGLKIESKSIENRNLEIVTSLVPGITVCQWHYSFYFISGPLAHKKQTKHKRHKDKHTHTDTK